MINKRKKIITFFLVYIIDIILIIFCAKNYNIHYITFMNKKIRYANYKTILIGKNYETLIVTAFTYIYILLLKKIALKKQNKIIKSILLLLVLTINNMIVFYLFTNKIY